MQITCKTLIHNTLAVKQSAVVHVHTLACVLSIFSGPD